MPEPGEIVKAARALGDPDLDADVHEVVTDVEGRSMYESGETVRRTIETARGHGYRWKETRFVPMRWRRLNRWARYWSPLVTLAVAVAGAVTGITSLIWHIAS